MDSLHFSVAVFPLAVYLFLLGILNLRNRPFVTTGARDSAALAIGLIGFMVIGPMKLFFPEAAASRFGLLVWLMLIVFYALCISLSVLLMRSRIVIYNITLEHLRPILMGIAQRMDARSRWHGNALWMPEQKIHLHVEPVEWLRNVELTAGGNQQSYDAWRTLEKELNQSLRKIPIEPNTMGLPFLISAIMLACGAVVWMLRDKEGVAMAVKELLMY